MPDEKSITIEDVQDHARRYMEAVYGKSVWFAAPETFQNVLERWIWGVASDSVYWTEESIARIEELAAEHRKQAHK